MVWKRNIIWPATLFLYWYLGALAVGQPFDPEGWIQLPAVGIFGFHLPVKPHLERVIEESIADMIPAYPFLTDRYLDDYAKRNELAIKRDVTSGGLLDDFSQLQSEDFNPHLVHTKIRDFYEHTTTYDLNVDMKVATWTRISMLPYFAYARSRNQLSLPNEKGRHDIRYRIDKVQTPRGSLVGWYRFHDDGSIVYFGLYSVVRIDSRAYIMVQFPLPEGFLTVVLRPQNLPNGGLHLSTLPSTDNDLAGHYFTMRKPDGSKKKTIKYSAFEEKFDIEYDEPLGLVRCIQIFYNFSRRLLDLDYIFRPKN